MVSWVAFFAMNLRSSRSRIGFPQRLAVTAVVLLMSLFLALPQGTAQETFKPFKLRTLSGKEKTLADFSNQVILISFFFPTCPYCNKSLPEVQRIYDKYKDKGLSAVWINTLPAQDRLIPEWQKTRHFTVPILVAGNPTALQYDYRIKGTPTHYLISANGAVLWHVTGYREGGDADLELAVQEALGLLPDKKIDDTSREQVEEAFSSLPEPPRLTRANTESHMTVEERVAPGPPTTTIEGTLQRFDCLGRSARLLILSGGKRFAFAIVNPNVVTINGNNSSRIEFSCGLQKAIPLILEYEQTENKSLGTTGNIRSIRIK
jgi:thiol-disulfide isomerase/thioredoxin